MMRGLVTMMCKELLAQAQITGRLLRLKPRLQFNRHGEAYSALVGL